MTTRKLRRGDQGPWLLAVRSRQGESRKGHSQDSPNCIHKVGQGACWTEVSARAREDCPSRCSKVSTARLNLKLRRCNSLSVPCESLFTCFCTIPDTSGSGNRSARQALCRQRCTCGASNAFSIWRCRPQKQALPRPEPELQGNISRCSFRQLPYNLSWKC